MPQRDEDPMDDDGQTETIEGTLFATTLCLKGDIQLIPMVTDICLYGLFTLSFRMSWVFNRLLKSVVDCWNRPDGPTATLDKTR